MSVEDERCAGCGRAPGEGFDEDCEDAMGCGFYKAEMPEMVLNWFAARDDARWRGLGWLANAMRAAK